MNFSFRSIFYFSVTLLCIVGYGYFVFAVAPSGGYTPGQTLDPDCAPSDTDCLVTLSLLSIGNSIIGGTANQVLYADSSGNLTSDSAFTRDETTGDTVIGGMNNGTLFVVSDSAQAVGVQTAGTFTVYDTSGSYNPVLNVNTGSFSVEIGDSNSAANGTFIKVDDTNQEISFNYSGGSYAFPITSGTANYVLATNGSGALSWVTPGIKYGNAVTTGHNYEALYINGSGVLASDSGFVRNNTLNYTLISNTDALNGITTSMKVDAIGYAQLYAEDTYLDTRFFIQANASSGANLTGYNNSLNTSTTVTSNGSTAYLSASNSATGEQGAFQVFSTGAAYTVNTNTKSTTMSVGEGYMSFDYGDLGDLHSYFLFDPKTFKKYQIGDLNSINNGTVFTIDDSAQKITFNFAGDDYSFPTGDGTANYLLATDGSGQLFWQDPSVVSSDRTLKSDIANISYGLDTVLALNPVSYVLNSNGSHEIGFVAQEVQPIVPELVGTVANGKLGLRYGQLSAVIVKAIQDMYEKIISLTQLTGEWGGVLKNSLVAWFSNNGNGIDGFWAKDIHGNSVEVQALCIGTTCISESQLQQLLSSQGVSYSTTQSSSSDTSNDSTITDASSSTSSTDSGTSSRTGGSSSEVNSGATLDSESNTGQSSNDNSDGNQEVIIEADGSTDSGGTPSNSTPTSDDSAGTVSESDSSQG